jgi:hypothetical protein
MAFKDYVYESDKADESYKIRLDTDQQALSGASVGTTTSGFHVLTNKSRRSFGLHARRIIVKRVVGTAPNEKTFFTRLPICTAAQFAAPATADGATVTINGVTYVISGREAEFRR